MVMEREPRNYIYCVRSIEIAYYLNMLWRYLNRNDSFSPVCRLLLAQFVSRELARITS